MPAITTGKELQRVQDTNWSTRYFDSMTISMVGTLLPSIETGSWKECVVELNIAGAATVSFMESNNGSTWSSINSTLNLSTGAQGGTANASGKYSVPLAAKFFSVQVIAWSSGAVSLTALFNLTQTILFQQINPQRNQLTAQTQITLSTLIETTLMPASGTGFFNDISWICFSNTSATEAGVNIRSTTGGPVILEVEVPANDTVFLNFGGVSLMQPTANTVWTAQLDAAVTSINITAAASKNTI